MKLKYFAIIFILITLTICGCKKDKPISLYSNWKVYTIYNSGLPENSVWEVIADKNDNIWIITSSVKGLNKYNGINWTKYSIPGLTASPESVGGGNLQVDYNNNIWLSFKYDTILKFSNLNWNQIITPMTIGSYSVLVSQITVLRIDKQENIWIATPEGLIKYDGNNWTIYNTLNSAIPANEIISLATDIDNSVWLSTMANPVYGGKDALAHLDDTTFTIYTTTNSGLPGNGIMHIQIESNGIKWFVTGYGIAKYDGSNWTVYNSTNTSALVNATINNFYIDAQNNKWFCTQNNGLIKFDGSNWTTYNTGNSGIPSNTVYSVAVDSKNNVWVGTPKGLAVFK